jgi:hypothetical protein
MQFKLGQRFFALIFIIKFVDNFDSGLFSIKSTNDGSRNHVQITECALYKVTFDYLQHKKGKKMLDFEWPTITNGSCDGSRALMRNLLTMLGHDTLIYFKSVDSITNANSLVDLTDIFNGEAHFDNESFEKGAKRILLLMNAAQKSVKQNLFDSARDQIGRLTHTAQDFYSHSNWVEVEPELHNEVLGNFYFHEIFFRNKS